MRRCKLYKYENLLRNTTGNMISFDYSSYKFAQNNIVFLAVDACEIAFAPLSILI